MVEAQTSRQINIRAITHPDFERTIDVMARAFDDDPVMNYIAKQDGHRSQRIRRLMQVALTNLTFPYGETYVAEGFEGAMFWNPPGGRPHGLLNDLKQMPAMVRIAGVSGLPRAIGALGMMEKKHPEEPHYYLLAIGVDPPFQGQGIGTQMATPILARCDHEGVPAYLESSKERNVPLYERWGFKVVEMFDLPKGGPPVWRMWRDPQ